MQKTVGSRQSAAGSRQKAPLGSGSLPTAHCLLPPGSCRLSLRGQSLVEYAVLIAAVTAALVVMSDYVRRAFNAHAEAIEEELNGATQ